MSSSSHAAERIARQNRIDESCVDALWSKFVDLPLCAMQPQNSDVRAPKILLPELRFKSLLRAILKTLPETARLIIVDDNSARFDALRECDTEHSHSLFFSTQHFDALNYTDNSFHHILTEPCFASVCRAENILASCYRVLKPGGSLLWAAPCAGTFPAFFDIFDECLATVAPKKASEIHQIIRNATDETSVSETFSSLGFEIQASQFAQFTLEFQSTEQLLFSTLVETHYLGFCLNLGYPDVDGRQLLTQLVRSFHHYFQDCNISVPIRLKLYHTRKN